MTRSLAALLALLLFSAPLARAQGVVANPTGSFVRPANSTAYSSGQLVANSTTAANVVPIDLGPVTASAKGVQILKVRIYTSSTSITTATFRVHFYTAPPATITNGDGGAWSTSGVASYLGYADVTLTEAFTDGVFGSAQVAVLPAIAQRILGATPNLYALLEARSAYTPTSAEVITVIADTLQSP
jgi:hypothetical protein